VSSVGVSKRAVVRGDSRIVWNGMLLILGGEVYAG